MTVSDPAAVQETPGHFDASLTNYYRSETRYLECADLVIDHQKSSKQDLS